MENCPYAWTAVDADGGWSTTRCQWVDCDQAGTRQRSVFEEVALSQHSVTFLGIAVELPSFLPDSEQNFFIDSGLVKEDKMLVNSIGVLFRIDVVSH